MSQKNFVQGKKSYNKKESDKFFIKKYSKSNKNLEKIENADNIFTLKESLNQLVQKNSNKNVEILDSLMTKKGILKNHKKDKIIQKKSKIKKISDLLINENDIINNNKNDNTKDNDSFPKTKSIQVEKNIIIYGEPKTKINEFKKLSPKFMISIDLPNSLDNNFYNHQVTTSEIEMLKIDEKLPQENLNQIESKRNELRITNIFPFHFFIEKEKCYQELLKDLKGNENKNVDYKIKIAAIYLNILLNQKFPISNITFNDKNMNKFLIYELCLYLLVLFFKDFGKELNENDISDFLTCTAYCHLNYLFLLLILVNKTNKDIYNKSQNLNRKNPEVYYSFINFQKCRVLIELNAEKVDIMKYHLNFQAQNKIIKSILINILTNLSNINQELTNNIQTILTSVKQYTLKQVINNYIRNNQLISEKVETIINEIISPESIPNDYNYELNLNSSLEDKNENNIYEEEFIAPLIPFLPNKLSEDKRDYCLVLDLDETLVHYCEEENDAFVKIRYGTEKFIKTLNKYCEIVIFTASKKKYADIVIDGLEVKDYIDYKLYRQHTTLLNGYNVKDLSKLGRAMNKIIIIDNIENNYQLQPNNGLNIINFEGEESDFELEYLLNDLLPIVEKPGKDIFEELESVRKNMQKRYTNIY